MSSYPPVETPRAQRPKGLSYAAAATPKKASPKGPPPGLTPRSAYEAQVRKDAGPLPKDYGYDFRSPCPTPNDSRKARRRAGEAVTPMGALVGRYPHVRQSPNPRDPPKPVDKTDPASNRSAQKNTKGSRSAASATPQPGRRSSRLASVPRLSFDQYGPTPADDPSDPTFRAGNARQINLGGTMKLDSAEGRKLLSWYLVVGRARYELGDRVLKWQDMSPDEAKTYLRDIDGWEVLLAPSDGANRIWYSLADRVQSGKRQVRLVEMAHLAESGAASAWNRGLKGAVDAVPKNFEPEAVRLWGAFIKPLRKDGAQSARGADFMRHSPQVYCLQPRARNRGDAALQPVYLNPG